MENVEKFNNTVRSTCTNLGAFVKLYTIWIDLTIDERAAIINKGVLNGKIEILSKKED